MFILYTKKNEKAGNICSKKLVEKRGNLGKNNRKFFHHLNSIPPAFKQKQINVTISRYD